MGTHFCGSGFSWTEGILFLRCEGAKRGKSWIIISVSYDSASRKRAASWSIPPSLPAVRHEAGSRVFALS